MFFRCESWTAALSCATTSMIEQFGSIKTLFRPTAAPTHVRRSLWRLDLERQFLQSSISEAQQRLQLTRACPLLPKCDCLVSHNTAAQTPKRGPVISTVFPNLNRRVAIIGDHQGFSASFDSA